MKPVRREVRRPRQADDHSGRFLIPEPAIPGSSATSWTCLGEELTTPRPTRTRGPTSGTGSGELLAIGGVAFDESEPSGELAGILRGGNFGGFAPLPATEVEVEELEARFVAQESSAVASVLRGVDAGLRRGVDPRTRERLTRGL